jgi:transcriptional regulator with XRE-family HTH domain
MPLDPAKLKSIRARLGISQTEAAHRAGIHQQAYQRIEAGRRPDPQLSTLERLAEALGVDVGELICQQKRPTR